MHCHRNHELSRWGAIYRCAGAKGISPLPNPLLWSAPSLTCLAEFGKYGVSPQTYDCKGLDGVAEAFEGERSQFFGLEFPGHIGMDAVVDEYLSRFGFVAEPRREIRDIADRGIIEPPIEAYAAEGGKADCDADPEAEAMAALPPNFRQIIDFGRACRRRDAPPVRCGRHRAGDR